MLVWHTDWKQEETASLAFLKALLFVYEMVGVVYFPNLKLFHNVKDSYFSETFQIYVVLRADTSVPKLIFVPLYIYKFMKWQKFIVFPQIFLLNEAQTEAVGTSTPFEQ